MTKILLDVSKKQLNNLKTVMKLVGESFSEYNEESGDFRLWEMELK